MLLRPRVWVYSAILLIALSGILYGVSSLDAIELKVLHERAPLFVAMKDGSIQNKYTLKVLNKMTENIPVRVSASGLDGLELIGADEEINARNGFVSPAIVFVRVPRKDLKEEHEPITFHVEGTRSSGEIVSADRESVFIGPRR
ncbi:MAG: FixG Ig-like domain-containing protein [Pseudomonadota bacterium]|nr:FixG Ig-like domain-containing protein [Pseudomonadota bacterium]